MGLTAAAVDEPKLTEPVVIYQPELIKRRYPIVKISSGCHHLLLLNSEGQILTTGAGDSGQLGRVPARENLRYSGNGNDFLLLLWMQL